MADFVVKVDEKSFNSLANINRAIGKLSKKGAKALSEADHANLRKLLNKRADVLSSILGKKVHSLWD